MRTAADRLAGDGGANSGRSPAKQLKWDKTVMDSLEAQGFQRRESSATKLVYDYQQQQQQDVVEPTLEDDEDDAVVEPPQKSAVVHKSTVQKPIAVAATKVARSTSVAAPPKSLASVVVSKGLVSGRAALFERPGEHSAAGGSRGGAAANRKDPAEMSLKDRMALFEKNKGTALVPKAAFGMSASQKQISGDQPNEQKDEPQKQVKHGYVPVGQKAATTTTVKAAPVANVVRNQSITNADRPNKIDGYNNAGEL